MITIEGEGDVTSEFREKVLGAACCIPCIY